MNADIKSENANTAADRTGVVARSITKRFATRGGAISVLLDVDLSVAAGTSVAITGPSGSGKSTLLNILGTLEPPTSGTLTIHGANPFALGERELARFRNQRIGFVFQEAHLLPQCTALENVLVPALAGYGPKDADNLERAQRLLNRVGLAQRHDHRPGELSGGERQRVALARALVNAPDLLLADEPTGSLDRETAEEIGSLLLEIHQENRTALVVVTHSEALARRMDREWRLIDGRLKTG